MFSFDREELLKLRIETKFSIPDLPFLVGDDIDFRIKKGVLIDIMKENDVDRWVDINPISITLIEIVYYGNGSIEHQLEIRYISFKGLDIWVYPHDIRLFFRDVKLKDLLDE